MAKKQTLRAGRGHACTVGDMLDVTYVGWLAGSDPHDESKRFDEGMHFQFVLGAGEVIPGWDSTFVGMLEGEKARLYVPAAQAYGARGMPPKIPPNADLLFEVQINGVVCAPPAVMRAVVRANADAKKPRAKPQQQQQQQPPVAPFNEHRLHELIPSPPKRGHQMSAATQLQPASAMGGAPPPGTQPSGQVARGAYTHTHTHTHTHAHTHMPATQPSGQVALSRSLIPSGQVVVLRPGPLSKPTSSGMRPYERGAANASAATPASSIDPAAAPTHAPEAIGGVGDGGGERLGTTSRSTKSKSVHFDASVRLPSPTASTTDPRKYHDRAIAGIMQRKMSEQTSALQQAFPFGVPGQGDFMRQGFKYL